MERRDYPIRIQKLTEQGNEPDLRATTAAQRIAMMWQLALNAWAFKGAPDVNPDFRRHAVRLLRRER